MRNTFVYSKHKIHTWKGIEGKVLVESLNIEAVFISWLGERIECPVVADTPSPCPPAFVSVERVGGGRDNVSVDYPELSILCWATSRFEAAQLAYEVDAQLADFAHEPRIAKIKRSMLRNHPDETDNKARYQILVDITTA